MSEIICVECGKVCSPSSRFCTGCGARLPVEDKGSEKIKSHMTAAVLTTVLFGNWILGIPAIVFARECELASEAGQTEIAARFSRRALTYLLTGSALCFALLCFVLLMLSIS